MQCAGVMGRDRYGRVVLRVVVPVAYAVHMRSLALIKAPIEPEKFELPEHGTWALDISISTVRAQ